MNCVCQYGNDDNGESRQPGRQSDTDEQSTDAVYRPDIYIRQCMAQNWKQDWWKWSMMGKKVSSLTPYCPLCSFVHDRFWGARHRAFRSSLLLSAFAGSAPERYQRRTYPFCQFQAHLMSNRTMKDVIVIYEHIYAHQQGAREVHGYCGAPFTLLVHLHVPVMWIVSLICSPMTVVFVSWRACFRYLKLLLSLTLWITRFSITSWPIWSFTVLFDDSK